MKHQESFLESKGCKGLSIFRRGEFPFLEIFKQYTLYFNFHIFLTLSIFSSHLSTPIPIPWAEEWEQMIKGCSEI